MTADPSPNEHQVDELEELTAYLDGELEPGEMQRVEQRLAADESYRKQLQKLQQTWDLLDSLPMATPKSSFTQTTMELVVGEATREARKNSNSNIWLWLPRIALLAIPPAALFFLSFILIRGSQTQSDRFLIERLPTIQNLEKYRYLKDDLKFLEALYEARVFSNSDFTSGDTLSEAALSDGAGTEQLPGIDNIDESTIPASLAQRRDWVAGLPAQEKVHLKRNLDDYLKRTPPEQARIDSLDAALRAHPKQAQLTAVMVAFNAWFDSLDAGERARLLDKPIEKRIVMIEDLKNQQARDSISILAELPSEFDANMFFSWYDGTFALRELEIRDRYPQAVIEYAASINRRAPSESALQRRAQSASIATLVSRLLAIDRPFIESLIEESDLENLNNMLSVRGRQVLQERTIPDQKDLVLSWMTSVNQSLFDVSISELRKFAQTLKQSEKAELDKLSPDNYRKQLKQRYYRARVPESLDSLMREAGVERLGDFEE